MREGTICKCIKIRYDVVCSLSENFKKNSIHFLYEHEEAVKIDKYQNIPFVN